VQRDSVFLHFSFFRSFVVRRDWNFVGMPLENIKVRSCWQKFQHGEVAAVIGQLEGDKNTPMN
jgi:hypothetical protein